MIPKTYDKLNKISDLPRQVSPGSAEQIEIAIKGKTENIKQKLSDDNNHEHVFQLGELVTDSVPDWVNQGSAFNEKTFQDLKYHVKAHEIYYCLSGNFSVLWRESFKESRLDNSLHVGTGSWVHIPPGYCLVVEGGKFIAVAFKTEESTIGNGQKISGTNCSYFYAMTCQIRDQCAARQYLRSSYLGLIKASEPPWTDEQAKAELRKFIP